MKTRIIISTLILALTAASCSVSNYLQGERLFKGAEIQIDKAADVKESNANLKSVIELATRPEHNKFILGFPYKVWFWYNIGEPKTDKGIRKFLRQKLAEPPVLSNRVNVKAAAENIQSLLENLGYFHSTAKGDTVNSKQFCKAIYKVKVEPQYLINEVSWVKDSSSAILQLLEDDCKTNSLLKTGDAYRLSDITAERERIGAFAKTKGYYYFHPDYLMAYADSTIGNKKVNLLLNLKHTAPAEARSVYTIKNITVYPDFSLGDYFSQNHVLSSKETDEILIKQNSNLFKTKLIEKSITYRPDTVYNSEMINATLNRLINLGTFKFVKNKFDTISGHANNQLAVTYFLTPYKKKSIQTSLDAFSKDNSFVGSKISLNWKNKNTFGGAEQLAVKVYGGFEVATTDSLKVNNNFRAGTEVSLKFPSYVVPFFKINENSFYPGNTAISMGYEWYEKRLYYTKNFFKLQYEFIKKPSAKTQINFAPIALSYTNATNVTDSFYREANINPSLLVNVYAETILGTYLSFSKFSEQPRHKWYINTSIDVSGNMAGLITGARYYREKKIIKAPFAQYVKLDVDLHYTKAVGRKKSFANRLQIGLGLPYHNSKALPFSKLYTIGGSSSLRGFNAGTIGPGSLVPSALNRGLYQIIGGDMKLLFNTELRMPISKYFSLAWFADIGNTWTKDTLLFGDPGKISKDFYKEIAFCTGTGLRFDATILLIRADLGIPLRKPFLPENERWVMNKIAFGDSQWRRENLILNIAIGLPF